MPDICPNCKQPFKPNPKVQFDPESFKFYCEHCGEFVKPEWKWECLMKEVLTYKKDT